MSSTTALKDSNTHYHTQCTGLALDTVRQHIPPHNTISVITTTRSSTTGDTNVSSVERQQLPAGSVEDGGEKDQTMTFFGACFCPFVQRVWIALEVLGVPYYYYEVDPYAKPKDLLEVSPKGLVPGLKLNEFSPPRGLNESTVILEYLEDLAAVKGNGKSLLPPKTDPYARALIRLQADHINRTLVPSFYRYLQAQDPDAQIKNGKEFLDAIEGLVKLFERAAIEGSASGVWRGGEINLADVLVGPWLFRATNVLKHYRGFDFPSSSAQFKAYLARLFDHPAFKATCSTEQLYLDSYERYAFNRPNTSQVAEAINSGRGLP